MSQRYQFNRLEFAGALGDLGSLIPIAMAMILVNGISPVGIFFSVAIAYLASGLYYGVTVPIQPMKIIAAYAIATGMNSDQIFASCLLMAILLLIIALSNSIKYIKKYTPYVIICGVQFTTGVLLMLGGLDFILGYSPFQTLQQSAEPYLQIQTIGPLATGIVIAAFAFVTTLIFLKSRKYPAGLILILGGAVGGYLLGARPQLELENLGWHFPEIMSFPFPGQIDFSLALFALVIPQLPMTMGNAVLAYSDLSKKYFANKSEKVTEKNCCLSMAVANIFSFIFGGIPICHGAGGLAAHYQFGARSAGANIIIGSILLLLTLLLGENIVALFYLLPMAILGVLLIFAGWQLVLTIRTLSNKIDFLIILCMLFITLASNLAWGFILGLLLVVLHKTFIKYP